MTEVVTLCQAHDVRIDRSGERVYGNPFRIGVDGNRETCIALHMEMWRTRIDSDSAWAIEKLLYLKGKRLGCHCKPKSCHGDNYVKLIAEYCP